MRKMKTSLYRYFGHENELLYVGVSHHPCARMGQHAQSRDMSQVRYVELEWFKSRGEAAAAEAIAIKRERPKWNIALVPAPRKCRVTTFTDTPKVAQKPKGAIVEDCGPVIPSLIGPPKPWVHYQIGRVDSAPSNAHCITWQEAKRLVRAGDIIHADCPPNPEVMNWAIRRQTHVLMHFEGQ